MGLSGFVPGFIVDVSDFGGLDTSGFLVGVSDLGLGGGFMDAPGFLGLVGVVSDLGLSGGFMDAPGFFDLVDGGTIS